jgi:hypothetical protein
MVSSETIFPRSHFCLGWCSRFLLGSSVLLSLRMTIRPWTHLHATRHRYHILVVVSVPERVIVSAGEKLRSAKFLKVRSKEANGLGSPTLFVPLLARSKCEVRESRLPRTTGQPLPPTCKSHVISVSVPAFK